jgi:uncharacterized protein (TIGR03435 family)
MKQPLLAVLWLGSSLLAASAQTPQNTPEFEVASVKPAPAGNVPLGMPRVIREKIGFNEHPGRIDYHGVSLLMLLARAYNMKSDQISGPAWLDTENYTIAAKLPPDTSADQLRLMLQKLLTERFQISLHRETKEMPVYRLMVAKNGPKLKPPEEEPQNLSAEERTAMVKKRNEEFQARMKEMAAKGIRTAGTRSFSMSGATMEKFAEMLSSHLDRPVKDMTELKGEYSFHLEWTQDNGPSTSSDETSGPSIFAAIQEQLGLRLESGKDLIDLLVVDKAQKVPASN